MRHSGEDWCPQIDDLPGASSQQRSVRIPTRPKYNGGVERGNRTFREEFYACRDLIADSIGDMRFELRKAVEKYNTFRPHHALKSKTPMEYLRNTQAEAE